MTIVRNDDGTLVVPVREERAHDEEEEAGEEKTVATAEATRVLHPGEGGYDEALVEWDLQQHPDREAAVSTPSGRQEAMALVHAVAESPRHDVSAAIEAVDDP
jgi:signal transduction protein with GAF and PtsI domain